MTDKLPTPRPEAWPIFRRRNQGGAELLRVRRLMITGQISPEDLKRQCRMYENFDMSRDSIVDEIDGYVEHQQVLAAWEGRMMTCPEHFDSRESTTEVLPRVTIPEFSLARAQLESILAASMVPSKRRSSSLLALAPDSVIRGAGFWQNLKRVLAGFVFSEDRATTQNASAHSESSGETRRTSSPAQALPQDPSDGWLGSIRGRRISVASPHGILPEAPLSPKSLPLEQKRVSSQPNNTTQRPREEKFMRRASTAVFQSLGLIKRTDSITPIPPHAASPTPAPITRRHQQRVFVHGESPYRELTGHNSDLCNSDGNISDMSPSFVERCDDEGRMLGHMLWAEDIEGKPF